MNNLNDSQVDFEDSKITISVKKAPLMIRFSFGLLVFILGIMPIGVTTLALTYWESLHIGLLFSFILCWGVGFYLLKVTLWNWIGREVLTLKPQSIHYIANYILFKDGHQKINTSNLDASVVFNPTSSQGFGTLILTNKNESLCTTVQLSEIDLKKLKDFIERKYIKN